MDNFIVRTLNRISDSWVLCRQEFFEASQCMKEESVERAKAEAEKQRSWIVEEMKKKASEALSGKKEEMVNQASDGEEK